MEAFIRNLYELAEHCEFGTQRDEQIRDRIVTGILEKSLLQNLQMKSDLTHDATIQMTRQSELVKFQVAGQSDDKHFGEVNQAKGKPNPERGGNRNLHHKNSKNTLFARPYSRCNCIHKEGEIFPAKERDVLNIGKLANLLLFAVPLEK